MLDEEDGEGEVGGERTEHPGERRGPPVEAAIPSTVGACRPAVAALGRAAGPRPAHSVPIGRRRITGTWAMIRSCVQISPATPS